MIVSMIIYFTFYAIALGVIVSVGYVLQRGKERKYVEQETKIDISEMVVLIPFRNEEHRLPELLASINELESVPEQFVFIDDHSEDKSIEIIENTLGEIEYRIVRLPNEVTGKKMALRYATGLTQSKYILTIDADVQFAPNYFNSISNLGDADMYVLPAILKAKKWQEHFYEIDLLVVTATNTGLAGLKRPIMASGANLLYKRDTFQRVDNIESHAHSASGDDTYLLRDFRENHTDVRLLTDPSCAVLTETPQSFREFIDQRLRWIGKTGDINDNLSTFLAVLQVVLTVSFFGLLCWFLFTQQWMLFGILFGLKSLIDLLLFYPYCSRVKRLTSWVFLPLYELFFPIYTLLLVLLLFTYKPKWKGRQIYDLKN